jgi:hypothetical protein
MYILDPSSKLKLHESSGMRILGFSCSSADIATHYATLIFSIKALTYFECKYQIIPATLLVFVDAGENSIMVNDVVMFSNFSIVPV